MNHLPATSNWIALAVLAGLALFSPHPSSAQTVSTFLTGSGLNGPDGFALDSEEDLFVANWGGGSGTTILKVTSLAEVTTFDATSSAPDGLAFDSQGNLYVSNYGTGVIHRITPTGTKTVFATGLNHPSALAFDANGNLYVSNYGGTTVSRITPDGTVSTFASGFHAPLGLVFDPGGNLYVSNYNTGVVNKVDPAGTVTVFATVPSPAGSMVQYLVRGPSGTLYLPSYGHNKIYSISPAGMVSVFAGTGVPGGNDGPVATAQFNGPNSIAMDSAGNLFVSEYNANRIRKITGVEPAAAAEEHSENLSREILSLQSFPNPFTTLTTIRYRLARGCHVTLLIANSLGEVIASLVNGFQDSGPHSVSFDAAGLPAGTYFCRLTHGSARQTKKLVVVGGAH